MADYQEVLVVFSFREDIGNEEPAWKIDSFFFVFGKICSFHNFFVICSPENESNWDNQERCRSG